MAVKVKFLKQILSLKKQGCSNEVCVQAILQGCKTEHEQIDTIIAFYQEVELNPWQMAFDRVKSEYLGHLEICSRQRKEELPME